MIDLNEIASDTQQRKFPATVFDEMPALISDGLDVLTDPTEKTVFLMGALGVISGLIPNVVGLYDGCRVHPNLFVYVMGGYGSGKGGLRYARELGAAVHQQKLAEIYHFMIGQPDPVVFTFTPEQQTRFLNHFRKLKTALLKCIARHV